MESGDIIPDDCAPEEGIPLKKLAITPSERSPTSICRSLSDAMEDSHRPIDGDKHPGVNIATFSSVVCC